MPPSNDSKDSKKEIPPVRHINKAKLIYLGKILAPKIEDTYYTMILEGYAPIRIPEDSYLSIKLISDDGRLGSDFGKLGSD